MTIWRAFRIQMASDRVPLAGHFYTYWVRCWLCGSSGAPRSITFSRKKLQISSKSACKTFLISSQTVSSSCLLLLKRSPIRIKTPITMKAVAKKTKTKTRACMTMKVEACPSQATPSQHRYWMAISKVSSIQRRRHKMISVL